MKRVADRYSSPLGGFDSRLKRYEVDHVSPITVTRA